MKTLLEQEIQELLKQRNWRVIKDTLSSCPVPEIVSLLEDIDNKERVLLFRLLPRHMAADVFSELDQDRRINIFQQMSNEHIREILSGLSPDDRTDLFEEIPGKITQKLLNLLTLEDRKETLQLLGYPERSVGRLMTPDYVAIRPHWTVQQALDHVRQYGRDAETIDMVYVTDEAWRLLDDISLRKLLLTDPEQKVESVMDRQVVSIQVSEDQEQAVRITERYNLVAIPVVDSENVLLGIVTVDDILDVIEEEVSEDVQKGAGVVPLEIKYSDASVRTLYRKRIVWLSLLLAAGFFSGSVIAYFEKTLGAIIALAFFIPVLIGTGGNTGTQSATLIIRALSTGDLTIKKWFYVIRKELKVGFLIGGTLGPALYLWSYFWQGSHLISLVLGMSAVVISIWANLVGSLLPIVLRKLRLDPAVISSPLISTLLDVTGLLIYFLIAIGLLKV